MAAYVYDMSCYKPLTAWYAKEINPTGKRSLVFNQKYALQADDPLEVGCGQCAGCRLDRSRQWAIRCLHESQMFEDNSFITLTFSDPELNKREVPDSLDLTEFQRFMKRLREDTVPKNPNCRKTNKEAFDQWQYDNGIRFFHCGEYGEKYGRPHYHAILFNIEFKDKYLWQTRNGMRYYRSPTLEKHWPHGMAIIGDVTFESAAYVARYIMKKVNGDNADEHYKKLIIDEQTGELKDSYQIKPEYTTMSRRPGIGSKWFEKYKTDVYPSDFITVNGKKINPPKYYDKLLQQEDPYLLQDLKNERVERAREHYDNNTPERLEVRAALLGRRLERLLRHVDMEN